jgi:hypothetical protein
MHSKPFELYTPQTAMSRAPHSFLASPKADPPALRTPSVRGTADAHDRWHVPLHSTVPAAQTHALPARMRPAGHEKPHGSEAEQMGDAPVG